MDPFFAHLLKAVLQLSMGKLMGLGGGGAGGAYSLPISSFRSANSKDVHFMSMERMSSWPKVEETRGDPRRRGSGMAMFV